MEVFLRNVPPDMSDASLTTQLEPFMQKLSITYYLCEKPKRKPIAHITFLDVNDGRKFLLRHGEQVIGTPQPQPPARPQARQGQNGSDPANAQWAKQQHPKTLARLHLMGRHIKCKISDRAPDQFTLRSIKDEVDLRRAKAAAQAEGRDKASHAPTTLRSMAVDCGYHSFMNNKLHFVGEWNAPQEGTLKLGTQKLIIHIPILETQIHINYRQIYELLWSDEGALFFTLTSPPMFLREETLMKKLVRMSLEEMVFKTKKKASHRRVPAINAAHEKISSFCLVYHVRVDPNYNAQSLRQIMKRLNDTDLVHVNRYKVPMIEHPTRFPRYDVAVAQFTQWLGQAAGSGDIPFPVMFQLQAMVYNCYLHPSVVQAVAISLLALFKTAKKTNAKPPVSVEAMRKVATWFPFPSPFDTDPRYFEAEGYMEALLEAQQEMDKGNVLTPGSALGLAATTANQTRVFRAVVSPGRITLHGPELEASNRVLRKYPKHQEHFIRAQFVDEDGQDLFYKAGIDLDTIYARFKEVLNKGVSIAGRQYKFLGFSHSSLRSHSAWMSAPFFFEKKLHIRDFIVTGLGDFNKIRCSARQAARIGQAFSETPFTVPLDEANITVAQIADVERDGRVFSDGVGTISPEAAEAVWDYIPQKKGAPTAYQIRFGGAKGMLAVDSSLPGRMFCIRPSMEKFPSPDVNDLEICDMASKPIALVLNRSLIKILEDMNVPESWFLRRQEEELRRLRGITANAVNTANFLKKQGVGEGFRLDRFIRQTSQIGIDYRKDDFLRNAVEAVILKELRLLKHKARIPVPEGITLFGVMDETGFLKQGEVFIQFDHKGGLHEPCPSDHAVLVTRSPALHPGDVQPAITRAPPPGHGLWQVRNCIVFSQWGARDLPSQLSGGDLDGDLFHVIWDQEAVHKGLRCYQPADYPRVPPRELDRPVEAEDIVDFFVDFMKTDHLGVIANRHLVFADQLTGGTVERECLALAQLHSTAVDFSKTGIPVEMSELPKSRDPKWIKWKPDFMAPGPLTTVHDRSEIEMDEYHYTENVGEDDEDQGPRYRYYRSDKILGQLFRNVDEHKIWYTDIKKTVPKGDMSFWDQLIAVARKRCRAVGVTRWDRWIETARNLRHVYEDSISQAASNHSEHPVQPLGELEVFIGFIINRTGYQTNRQRDASQKLEEDMERIGTETARLISIPAAAEDDTSTNGGAEGGARHGLEMAMACLEVGCYPNFQPKYASRRNDYQSFRVIAGAVLLRELSRAEEEMDGSAGGGGGGYVRVSAGAGARGPSVGPAAVGGAAVGGAVVGVGLGKVGGAVGVRRFVPSQVEMRKVTGA